MYHKMRETIRWLHLRDITFSALAKQYQEISVFSLVLDLSQSVVLHIFFKKQNKTNDKHYL